jgi:uncharacterized protein (TIGR03435 family)
MANALDTTIAALVFSAGAMLAQPPATRSAPDAFEVATIKPTAPDWKSGRFIRMQGAEFVARNHTVKTLIAAAYNLSPRAISGGPPWVESDHYDIFAKPTGSNRPNFDQQAAMLRKLLAERFNLTFHREPKVLSIYALSIAKNGPKLEAGTVTSDGPPPLAVVIGPHGVWLPARDISIGEFVSVMQRAALDRPVVDKTGLTGRYDFKLAWTPDESQFGGMAPRETPESAEPDLFTAIQQQLGLKLEATRGPVDVFVIDKVERPSDN